MGVKLNLLQADLKFEHPYIDDVKTIRAAIVKNGYFCTLEEASDIWDKYSDNYCASWLMLPKDNESIMAIIKETVLEEFNN